MEEREGGGGGSTGVYGTFLLYNFSGTAVASETRVIIGRELKVRGEPLQLNLHLEMDMIAS